MAKLRVYELAKELEMTNNDLVARLAVAGGYGTLSEIALALKIGKTVVALRPEFDINGVRRVETVSETLDVVFDQPIAG